MSLMPKRLKLSSILLIRSVRHTSGDLAKTVFEFFTSYALTSAYKNIFDEAIVMTELVLKHVNDLNDQARLRSALDNLSGNTDSFSRKMVNQYSDLTFYVGIEITSQIDSLETTNTALLYDLKDYSNIDMAIEVAKAKNQNYQAQIYKLESAKERNEALKAKLNRPSIAIVAGDDWSHTQYNGRVTSSGGSGYVALEGRYSIGRGKSSQLEAAKNRMSAAQKNVDSEFELFEHNIRSTFSRLENSDNETAASKARFEKVQMQIQDFLAKHTANGSVLTTSDVTLYLDYVNSYVNEKLNYYNNLQQSISYRFSLEQYIGILFDAAQARSLDLQK